MLAGPRTGPTQTGDFMLTSRSLILLASLVFTAAPALAQNETSDPSLTVNPDTLQAGETATINYSNPEMAGETVTVEVDNGDPVNPETDSVEIPLDANGNGSADWPVPDWPVAKFNAPDAPEVEKDIL